MRRAWTRSSALLGALLLLLAPATSVTLQAATLRVGPTHEYATIGAALTQAASGDTILVSSGTYSGPDNRGLNFENRDVALVSETGAASTIIDCEGLDRALEFHLYARSTAVVDGFTIRNGSAEFGGGIYCVFSAPEIRNCRIEHCTAARAGGAIRYSETPDAVLENCDFYYNVADRGGALSTLDTTIELTDCDAFYNSARSGGAMHLHRGTTSLRDCALRYNVADECGGAVYADASVLLEAYDSLFTHGSAGENGGGIYAGSAAIRMNNCEVGANSAGGSSGGGGIFVKSGSWELTDCLIGGNSANHAGGVYIVAYNSTETGSIVGCTFIDNDGTNGCSAAFLYNSEVSHCVFHGNWAARGTCGLDEYHCDVRNCTFTRNASANNGANISGHGGTIERCIVGFTPVGCAFDFPSWEMPVVQQCLVYQNANGMGTSFPGVAMFDPKFCDVYGADVSLCGNSPCLPDAPMNPYDVLLGALEAGCGDCTSPVEPMSWGAIKALYR